MTKNQTFVFFTLLLPALPGIPNWTATGGSGAGAADFADGKLVAYAKARCEKEKPFEERFFPSRALPFPNLFEPL